MNKALIWLPALLTVGVTTLKPVKEARTSKIEDKAISLVIYKCADYTSPVYKNSTAEAQITIEKVNTKGERVIVWGKTISSETLSQYPSFTNAEPQKVTVPNVNKKNEHLEVTYILTYNSDGSELQMQGGDIVTQADERIHIKI
jgi:hypothetical protein